MARTLVAGGIATEKALDALRAEVEREINEAAARALAAPRPARDTAALWVFSSRRRPGVGRLSDRPGARRQARHDGGGHHRALKDELARDPRIVVFGQDVADCSREASLARCRAKAACSR